MPVPGCTLDCGPGVPQSAWWDNDQPLTATCISHLHADHCLGLASLRWSRQPLPIPVYVPAEVQDAGDSFDRGTGLPDPLLRLAPVAMHPFDTVSPVDGLAITAVPLQHDGMPTLGWVVEAGEATVAYLVDTKGLPPETWRYLDARARLDCAIVDSTFRPGKGSAGHHDVNEALDLGVRTRAATVVLTHTSPTTTGPSQGWSATWLRKPRATEASGSCARTTGCALTWFPCLWWALRGRWRSSGPGSQFGFEDAFLGTQYDLADRRKNRRSQQLVYERDPLLMTPTRPGMHVVTGHCFLAEHAKAYPRRYPGESLVNNPRTNRNNVGKT